MEQIRDGRSRGEADKRQIRASALAIIIPLGRAIIIGNGPSLKYLVLHTALLIIKQSRSLRRFIKTSRDVLDKRARANFSRQEHEMLYAFFLTL